MTWSVEVVRGTAAEFHARGLPEPLVPAVWWFEVTRPALVLGSAQPRATVDVAACEAAGVEVVYRRSGGGAVLLVPGEVVWFDVLVPRGHPRWNDDIGRAAWWVGEAVRSATGRDDAVVHTGPLVRTEWSSAVCFAGLGPGELTVGGAKLLGVSQRRTREGTRLQCALYRRWDPATLVGLLAPPRPPLADLLDVVATGDLTLPALLTALG
jgi:lipoate-protein ligase A